MVVILPTIIFKHCAILSSSFSTNERLSSILQLGQLTTLFNRLVYIILPSGRMGVITDLFHYLLNWKKHLSRPHFPAFISFLCEWNGASSYNLLFSFTSYIIRERQQIEEWQIHPIILHNFLAASRSADIFKALVHKALLQISQRSPGIYLAQNQTVLFSSGMSESAPSEASASPQFLQHFLKDVISRTSLATEIVFFGI